MTVVYVIDLYPAVMILIRCPVTITLLIDHQNIRMIEDVVRMGVPSWIPVRDRRLF